MKKLNTKDLEINLMKDTQEHRFETLLREIKDLAYMR